MAYLDTLDTDSDGYYLIGTLEQLRGFATYAYEQSAKVDYLEGKKFKLAADITLPEVAEGESNWSMLPGFRGEFNGDNHTIANMTIHTTGKAKGAFFGSVSSVGKVHKLNLTDVNISGNFGYCGGIAVYNYGTIENCNVTGSIQGTTWLGGISAENTGTIQYCFADVEISDVSCAGLTFKVTDNIDLSTVGYFESIGNNSNRFKGTFDGNGDNFTISNLTINTSGKSYLGLFGYVNGGTVKNVKLVNANVTGNVYVGGLVGYNYGGTVENCFVNATVAGNTFVGGSNNTRVYLLTLNGVEVSGETVNINGTTYYKGGEVTATAKTGYVVDSTITIDSDKTISATFDNDTTKHYVLANDMSTLANESNTATFPDLVQVYKLTLPEGVEVTSGEITISGEKYSKEK